MCLDPDCYRTASAYELLSAASKGYIGIDHRLLRALVDDPPKPVGEMLRFAMEDRQRDRVNLEEDLVSIFRHLKAPEALPYFIELVRREPFDIPDELVEAFALFPEKSAERLRELYEELGEDLGSEVAFLLASLRVWSPETLKLLLDRLEKDPGEAAFHLGLYGDPAAKPELERRLALTEAGGASEWRLRESIETAIADIDSPQPHVEHPPFNIWEQYPESALPQFSILSEEERLEFLSASPAEFRAEAAASFLSEKLSAAARSRLLQTAREDRDTAVRASAWESMGGAADRPEIREALLATLETTDAPLEERCGALVGLAGEADDPAIRRRILEFYELPEARAKALQAMHRSNDRRFARYFPPNLDNPDPEVRRRAIWGTGYFGIHSEAARLRALFENDEFREDALAAYTLAVPSEISRGRARALLRKVEREAGGLAPSEAELVEWAIDERLASLGLDPVFSADSEEDDGQPVEESPQKPGRNDPCTCGSGKKYKKCCGA